MRNVFNLPQLQGQEGFNRLMGLSEVNDHFLLLHSNNHWDNYSRYQWIMAIGARKVFNPQSTNSFEELKNFHNANPDWLFGHLNYDLKNQLEAVKSNNIDKLSFPLLQFFIPETIVYSKDNQLTVESLNHNTPESFLSTLPEFVSTKEDLYKDLEPLTSRKEYIRIVDHLKQHLQFGNIYELNFCIEFGRYEEVHPLTIFNRLNKLSSAPFAAYYKSEDQYMVCASPERYLQKWGDKLISQPIKGTARRSPDMKIDAALKLALSKDEKERAENVMIVDLVRNDLSRTAGKASVKVDELFGIYSFSGVHQMISTVSSQLDSSRFHFTDALKTSFPMGSMTGAPKIKAMELIDLYENFSRSLYSGSAGYITPNGDFDFNVVIRSLFYNAKTQYTSARVGSAITIHCNAEKEYEECLLKVENLFKSLHPVEATA